MLKCSKCGQNEETHPEPHEVMVRDNNDGKVYCAYCADSLSRLCWNAPAIIHHSDGTAFSFKSEVA